jgi:hypothetical protein
MDTPQAVQATAQAVAQELDRILVDIVAEIFNMEQPSPRNDEEAAVEAAAEMKEYRDCQDDPVLPPIEEPTEEELALVYEHSSAHGGATPLTIRPPSTTSSEDSHSSLSSDGSVVAGHTEGKAIDAQEALDDDDSISTKDAMKLMWEEMKKLRKSMVTNSTLKRQLDQKLEGTSKEIMGKVHQAVNNSTNSINTRLIALESSQDVLQRTINSKIESEVKRQFGLFVKFSDFFTSPKMLRPQNRPQNEPKILWLHFVAYHLDVDCPKNRSSGHRDCLFISGLTLDFRHPCELFVRSIFVYLLKMSNTSPSKQLDPVPHSN